MMYAIFLFGLDDTPEAEVYCLCCSENEISRELDSLDRHGVGYTYRKVM